MSPIGCLAMISVLIVLPRMSPHALIITHLHLLPPLHFPAVVLCCCQIVWAHLALLTYPQLFLSLIVLVSPSTVPVSVYYCSGCYLGLPFRLRFFWISPWYCCTSDLLVSTMSGLHFCSALDISVCWCLTTDCVLLCLCLIKPMKVLWVSTLGSTSMTLTGFKRS